MQRLQAASEAVERAKRDLATACAEMDAAIRNAKRIYLEPPSPEGADEALRRALLAPGEDVDDPAAMLERAWRAQAALDMYAGETREQRLVRAAAADQWVASYEEHGGDFPFGYPVCAMSYGGCGMHHTHGDRSKRLWLLKGAPFMVLCDEHLLVRRDPALMRYLLAFVSYHDATGLHNTTSAVLLSAPDPVPEWLYSVGADDRCVSCGCVQEDKANVIDDWFGAVRVQDDRFVWLCAECYFDESPPIENCSQCGRAGSTEVREWNESGTAIIPLEPVFRVGDGVIEFICGHCTRKK